MGTGLTCGFAAASNRGILQHAQHALDEETAMTSATISDFVTTGAGISDLVTTGAGPPAVGSLKTSSGHRISPKSPSFFSPISLRFLPARMP